MIYAGCWCCLYSVSLFYLGSISITRISGPYAPFILAPPGGSGGPSAQQCGPSAHPYGPSAHFPISSAIIDHHDMWFLTCVPNFSSLACLEVPQEPPRPRSHTWRTLKVPDWRLGKWGHSWRVGPSWETPRNLSWKFCEVLTWFGWDIEVCYPVTQNVTDIRHQTDRQYSNLI